MRACTVRITGAKSRLYWYADKIGETFEVEIDDDDPCEYIEVSDDPHSLGWVIDAEDCEEVEEA
jgi:hypothetical protein